VLPPGLPLLFAECANPQLHQRNPGLDHAAHDARVAVLVAFVGVAQVGS
jgi:hypothetical protein